LVYNLKLKISSLKNINETSLVKKKKLSGVLKILCTYSTKKEFLHEDTVTYLLTYYLPIGNYICIEIDIYNLKLRH